MMIQFRDKEVNVKENLTLTDAMVFTKLVVDNVFDETEYVPIYRDLAITKSFLTMYTDITISDLDEIYNNMTEYKTFIDNIVTVDNFDYLQYDDIINNINELIEFKKEQIIHKSAMDEAFGSLATLLSTLNEKAKELDTKKLDKLLKKLNPQELIKAYQKSGIGENFRDKAIQDLAKENKELRNKENARNVLSDK